MSTPEAAAPLRFGRFELQPDERRLLVDGAPGGARWPRVRPAAGAGRAARPAGRQARADGPRLAGARGAGEQPRRADQRLAQGAGRRRDRHHPGARLSLRRVDRIGRPAAALEPASGRDGPRPPHGERPGAAHQPARRVARLARARRRAGCAGCAGRPTPTGQRRRRRRHRQVLARAAPARRASREAIRRACAGSSSTQVADAAALPGAVAAALGVDGGHGEPLAALIAAVAPLTMLLALDNAEHLLADVATLCQALHAAAPGLRLLVTSQAPLRLAAERVLRIGPLARAGRRAAGGAGAAVRRGGLVRRARAGGGPAIRGDGCQRAGGDRDLSCARWLAAGHRAGCGAGAAARDAAPAVLDARASSAADRQPQPCGAGAPADAALGAGVEPRPSAGRASSGCSGAWASWPAARRSSSSSRCWSMPMTRELDAWAVLDALDTLVDRSLVAVLPSGERSTSRATACSRPLVPTRWSVCRRRASRRRCSAATRWRWPRCSMPPTRNTSPAASAWTTGCAACEPDLDNARDALRWARARGRHRGGAAHRHDACCARCRRRCTWSAWRWPTPARRASDRRLPEALQLQAWIELSCVLADSQKARGRHAAEQALALARRLDARQRDRFVALPRAVPRRQRGGPGRRPGGGAGAARRAAAARGSVMAGAAPDLGRRGRAVVRSHGRRHRRCPAPRPPPDGAGPGARQRCGHRHRQPDRCRARRGRRRRRGASGQRN